MSAGAFESNLLPEGGGSSSSRKRQKLEVIRHPQNFKVEEEEYAGGHHAFNHTEPLCEPAEDDEEADEDDEDDEREQQRGPVAAFSATLVASPVYPNAIKWSDDNLIAVATSQLITILNPALIDGPRGFVTASSGPTFVVGTVQRKDIDASCLLPIRLSKDVRAVVRSIDWSPQGLASNGGCLLAVCTKDHRVKLYRAPHHEYQCEWVQVLDLSEMLYKYHYKSGFKVANQKEIPARHDQDTPGSVSSSTALLNHPEETFLHHESNFEGRTTNNLAIVSFDSSQSAVPETKFVMDSEHYVRYTNLLAYVSVAWSPAIGVLSNSSLKGTSLTMALIAVGAKSGEVTVLRCIQPTMNISEKVASLPEVSLIAILKAHESWISALAWSKSSKTVYKDEDAVTTCTEEIILATGSSDGSVKLWVGKVHNFMGATTSSAPMKLLRKVVSEDFAPPVTSIALVVPTQPSMCIQIAVGKASGCICTAVVDKEQDYQQVVSKCNAHLQAVTGIVWAFDGRCLYSCSQDNSLRAWKLVGRDLQALPFPEGSTRKTKGKVNLSNSVLDGHFGLGLSKGGLALATLRGVSAELLDQMYESRAMKAVSQVFWVGGQQFHVLPELNNPMMPVLHNSEYLQWESSILAALHHFEDTNHKLVLWDIIACFTYASSIVGKEFLHSTVYKWLLSLGLVHSDAQDNSSLVSLDSRKETLVSSSCRRLQIVYVILKRLLEYPGSSWHQLFLDVEHELRERLVHLCVLSAMISFQRNSLNAGHSEVIGSLGMIRMLQWVAANSSKVSPQLLNDGKLVIQRLKGDAETELCSTCKAEVPFSSADLGVCQGNHPHKLPRCSITFELCPPNPLWFCNCCGRRASKQTPRFLLTSTSRQSLMKLESSDILQDTEPTCLFCGILMQRYLPDCFLRLSLI